MLYEYTLVEKGIKYTELGYKTLEGEIPFKKLNDHNIIWGFINKHTPKPKKALIPTPGGKKHGKRY